MLAGPQNVCTGKDFRVLRFVKYALQSALELRCVHVCVCAHMCEHTCVSVSSELNTGALDRPSYLEHRTPKFFCYQWRLHISYYVNKGAIRFLKGLKTMKTRQNSFY